MPDPCNYVYRLPDALTFDAGEFCEDDAVEGGEFCAEHGRLIEEEA